MNNQEGNAPASKDLRRPRFTIRAMVTAVVTALAAGGVYSSGAGAGFEGFGAMLFGGIIAALGSVLTLAFSLAAIARRENLAWLNAIPVAICSGILWWAIA